jgi:hypothetical protein
VAISGTSPAQSIIPRIFLFPVGEGRSACIYHVTRLTSSSHPPALHPCLCPRTRHGARYMRTLYALCTLGTAVCVVECNNTAIRGSDWLDSFDQRGQWAGGEWNRGRPVLAANGRHPGHPAGGCEWLPGYVVYIRYPYSVRIVSKPLRHAPLVASAY